ncbi:inositol-tetrakisphosphate 1-kinase 5-like isoform X3 [Papaver somniferum]|uniref:inositol-tetrakisphosphate 1-kinase 5-like isoform X3 n=1 Tax=Papaver somniferum TaxID=3469 RepID=UPI000E6F9A69|nr:inositol-tetrakisphosphate 1-kinase 5-like isoform X3 [Papaver somniferum]
MAKRFQIGYAFTQKKNFIQGSLLNESRQRGIDLIKIDTDKPLIEQGPFDCILQKLSTESWIKQLEEYSLQNPNVLIIDSPSKIEILHDRISMLQVVEDLKMNGQVNETETATFGIPKQIVINDVGSLVAEGSKLKFPVIAKPLVADGSTLSHKMSLVYNRDGLNKLNTPVVLQEFVNHGGVIFKVYVVGDYVKCVKRKSLPDISEEELVGKDLEESCVTFSQISNKTSQERSGGMCNEVMRVEDAVMPPDSLVTDIARGLRHAMGLHLFNFDVIRDSRIDKESRTY